MDRIYEAKEYMMNLYAKWSRYFDMGARFLLALFIFIFINSRVGFLPILANPMAIIGLSIVCTFLPSQMTVLLATVVVLIQLGTLSPGIAAVTGVVFFIMFAFYFRFTPKQAILLLVTPIAFMMRVPIWIPIIAGLTSVSASIVPMIFGMLVYYIVSYVESYATMLETVAEAGVMAQTATFTQQLFANKEMWMTIISFMICLLLVYYIRRLSIDHAWAIATVAGVLANLIMMTFGHILLDVQVVYPELIVSSILGVGVAFLFHLFVFSVDYTRSEYLQFEDDEYYYYVKAVPKVTMTVREKTVKKIHVRQETETMDVNAIKKVADESNAKEMQETIDEENIRIQFEDSEIQRLIEEELKK